MKNRFHLTDEQSIYDITSFPNEIFLDDHIGGFDVDFRNPWLDHVSKSVVEPTTVTTYYIVNDQVKKNYPNLTFKLSRKQTDKVFQSLQKYNQPPEINYKNFVCSFNGSPHVSRKLLTSALNKFKWFDPAYCSKNFSYDSDEINGHIADYVGDRENFYSKFFISKDNQEFDQTIYSFGHVRFEHAQNIYNLQHKLTESFLHVVSETMATNCHPFTSEKPFYSIVSRGLFLSYAQQGWHEHFEKHFGFKRYNKIFDYRFDTIQNPVERLVELMSMISKFSVLSVDDWKDLYLMEQDTIEYNYDHYFGQGYLTCLENYE